MPLSNETIFVTKNPEKNPYSNVWIQDYSKANITVMITEGVVVEDENEYNLYFMGNVPGLQNSTPGMFGKLALHRTTYERKSDNGKVTVEPSLLEKKIIEQIEANKTLFLGSEQGKGFTGRLSLHGESFDGGKHIPFSKFEVAECSLTSLPPIPERKAGQNGYSKNGGGNTYNNYEPTKEQLEARLAFIKAQLKPYFDESMTLTEFFLAYSGFEPTDKVAINKGFEVALLLCDINPSSLLARLQDKDSPF